MIIVRLRGGLGNQMFQYAMGKRIALKLNTKLVLDLTSLLKKSKNPHVTNRDYQLHIFELDEAFFLEPKLIEKLYKYKLQWFLQLIKFFKSVLALNFKTYREKQHSVDKELIEKPTNHTLYSGYWQSETYFLDYENDIRKAFKFKEKLSPNAQDILEQIRDVNSVCVHVRRGDYIGNDFFQSPTLEYFSKCESYLKENNNLHFFVFSDDPEWCKENVSFNNPYTIVHYDTENLRYKEDLELMSNCKHFIISASSFSWWAVWLSNTDGIVIAPKVWYLDENTDVSDMINNKWIRL